MSVADDGDDSLQSGSTRSPAMGVSAIRRERQRSPSTTTEEGGRRSSGGILRLDPCSKTRRRSSGASVDLKAEARGIVTEIADPSSPCPSDRLSVTWADGERSLSSDVSVPCRQTQEQVENSSIATLLPNSSKPSLCHGRYEEIKDVPKSVMDVNTNLSLDTRQKLIADELGIDDDLGASISVILERSNSRRQSRKQRRNSSCRRPTKTSMRSTSSTDTVVNIESTADLVREKVQTFRDVLANVRDQPMPIEKKLKLCRAARSYLAENEFAEKERLARSTSTRDVIYRNFLAFKQAVSGGLIRFWNWFSSQEIWYSRFKRIESHFGSAVASYFYFLRWAIGLNSILVIITAAFIIIPELLTASRKHAGERKEMLREERVTGYDFTVIWNFEGIVRYSPFFYGYYSGIPLKSGPSYLMPEAYLLTFVLIFAFSFIMIIRKMTANHRMSKLSYDKTEFSWSLLGGWDYAIGDLEAAQNKVAAINMGFRELLQGTQKVEKKLKGWRLLLSRGFAHFLVLCMLASSFYAILFLVKRSMSEEGKSSWWRQNELSLILALISQIFPNIFKVVSRLEYRHPRQEVQMQLARIMVLNSLNLFTLSISLLNTTDDLHHNGTRIYENLKKDYCSLRETQFGTATSEHFRYPAQNTSSDIDLLATFAALNTTVLTSVVGFTSLNVSYPVFSSTELTFKLRNCSRIPIPCPTPTVSDNYDYIIFPNDTDIPFHFNTSSLMPEINGNFSTEVSSFSNVDRSAMHKFISSGHLSSTVDLDNESLSMPLLEASTVDSTSLLNMNSTESNSFELTTVNLGNLNQTKSTTEKEEGYTEYDYNEYFSTEATNKFRHKRQIDYDHNFSANSYNSRVFPYFYDPTTTRPPYGGNTTDPSFINLPHNYTEMSSDELNSTAVPLDLLIEGNSTNYESLFNSTDLNETRLEITTIGDDSDLLTFNTTVGENFIALLKNDSKNWLHISTPKTAVNDSFTATNEEESTENIRTETSLYEGTFLFPNECYQEVCEDDEEEVQDSVETTLVYSDSPMFMVTSNSTSPDNFLEEDQSLDSKIDCSQNLRELPVKTSLWNKSVTDKSMDIFDTLVENQNDVLRIELRHSCWETAIGQELAKIIVMDLVVTATIVFATEYIRALIVRFMNGKNCCWDLERQYPGYADFDVAESIFHLINNQGLVWMGMFFAPCLLALNLIKLVVLLYIRSWAVITSNVPPEIVYKASDNNNFYLLLLLAMLFLCMLPVWFIIVFLPPSWHCGPFSDDKRIYALLPGINFIIHPFSIVPILLLLVLAIYYYVSHTRALREANEDLYNQLCHERDEEKRKKREAMSGGPRDDTPTSRWKSLFSPTPLSDRPSLVSLTAKIRNVATAQSGDTALRTPLLSDTDPTPVSPPADDATDVGQFDVFDDSTSEPKKLPSQKRSHGDRKAGVKYTDVKHKVGSERKNSKDLYYKSDRKRRERHESFGSGNDSLPKSPKFYLKSKKFSLPEAIQTDIQSSSQTAKKESKETSLDKKDRSLSNKDGRRESKPSTPGMKPKHKRNEIRNQVESTKKIQQSSEGPKDTTASFPSRESSQGSKERARRSSSRSSDKGSKSGDSPRKRKSTRRKKHEGPPAVIVDMHENEEEAAKNESLETQQETNENDMQTIPLIKISKEDSVERSIEQAKLDRQKAIEVTESDAENIPMADDSDAPTVYERPFDETNIKLKTVSRDHDGSKNYHSKTNTEMPKEDSLEFCSQEDRLPSEEAKIATKKLSEIHDSPDMTNSASTPSSSSRRTYTVITHQDSDGEEVSEAYLRSEEMNSAQVKQDYEMYDATEAETKNTDSKRKKNETNITYSANVKTMRNTAPKAETEDDCLSNDDV